MKRILLSISIAAVFAACSNQKTADQTSTSKEFKIPDTTGLAELQSWKEQQSTLNMQGVNEVVDNSEPVKEVKAAPIVIYRNTPAPQAPVVRNTSRSVRNSRTRNTTSTPETSTPSSTSTSDDNSVENSGAGTGTASTGSGDGTNTGDVATAPVPAKKDGWSKAAKGTAIGGASGAVIGAILSKDKVKGAVIGGVVGAAGGYIFGRSKDKKDGRY
jgi:hypothetical protein